MRLMLLVFVLLFTSAVPAGAEPLERVRIFTDAPASLALEFERAGYDVLEGAATEVSVDLVVSPGERNQLEALGWTVERVAVGRPFRDIQIERSALAVPSGYPDLADVLSQMTAAATAYPSICDMVDLTATLGTPATFEGRHMFAVKISDNVTQDEDEPAFLMVSAHHCRELVTPVIALEAMNRFTSLYGTDSTITNLVDTYEIWIAPVWNPDGYNEVFTGNNLWRKNRRVFPTAIGVDLNRNYPFGWTNGCSGSTNPSSNIYKGPTAASEPETQTMMALSLQERFAKVVDFHSSGREVLHGYACWSHPFDAYLESEAESLSIAAGYGDIRPPSADGEHFEWQTGTQAALAFLMETATEFQPSFSSAQAEANQVFGGTKWLLERPIPLWGHVTDAQTGVGIEATFTYSGVTFGHGETNSSHPGTGRYHAFLADGTYDLLVEAAGYISKTVTGVAVSTDTSTELDIALFSSVTSVDQEDPSGTRVLSVDPLRRTLRYQIERAEHVRLRIYDVRGSLVAVLMDEDTPAGQHEIQWSGGGSRESSASSGVYFYRLEMGNTYHSGRLIQIR